MSLSAFLLSAKYLATAVAGLYGIYAILHDFHKVQPDGSRRLTSRGKSGILLLVVSTFLAVSADAFRDVQDDRRRRTEDSVRVAQATRDSVNAAQKATRDSLDAFQQLQAELAWHAEQRTHQGNLLDSLSGQLSMSRSMFDRIRQSDSAALQRAQVELHQLGRLLRPFRSLTLTASFSVPIPEPLGTQLFEGRPYEGRFPIDHQPEGRQFHFSMPEKLFIRVARPLNGTCAPASRETPDLLLSVALDSAHTTWRWLGDGRLAVDASNVTPEFEAEGDRIISVPDLASACLWADWDTFKYSGSRDAEEDAVRMSLARIAHSARLQLLLLQVGPQQIRIGGFQQTLREGFFSEVACRLPADLGRKYTAGDDVDRCRPA